MPPREPASGPTVFSAPSAPEAPALGEKLAGLPGQLLVPSFARSDPPSGLPHDLTMPPILLDILGPPLRTLGYRIETQKLEDPAGTVYQYSAVGRGDLHIPFLHIAAAILQDPARVPHVGFLLYPLKGGGFRMVRIISAEAQTVDLAYQQVWVQSKRFGIDALYIHWSDIQQLQRREEPERSRLLQFVLKLDDGAEIKNRLAELQKNGDDLKRLAQLLAKRAVNSVDVKHFFKDILRQTNLPEDWKLEQAGRWTGDAGLDAREFVRWLIGKGTNPEKKTCTALASLLTVLLEGNADDRSTLYQVIDEYLLIADAALLEELKNQWPIIS